MSAFRRLFVFAACSSQQTLPEPSTTGSPHSFKFPLYLCSSNIKSTLSIRPHAFLIDTLCFAMPHHIVPPIPRDLMDENPWNECPPAGAFSHMLPAVEAATTTRYSHIHSPFPLLLSRTAPRDGGIGDAIANEAAASQPPSLLLAPTTASFAVARGLVADHSHRSAAGDATNTLQSSSAASTSSLLLSARTPAHHHHYNPTCAVTTSGAIGATPIVVIVPQKQTSNSGSSSLRKRVSGLAPFVTVAVTISVAVIVMLTSVGALSPFALLSSDVDASLSSSSPSVSRSSAHSTLNTNNRISKRDDRNDYDSGGISFTPIHRNRRGGAAVSTLPTTGSGGENGLVATAVHPQQPKPEALQSPSAIAVGGAGDVSITPPPPLAAIEKEVPPLLSRQPPASSSLSSSSSRGRGSGRLSYHTDKPSRGRLYHGKRWPQHANQRDPNSLIEAKKRQFAEIHQGHDEKHAQFERERDSGDSKSVWTLRQLKNVNYYKFSKLDLNKALHLDDDTLSSDGTLSSASRIIKSEPVVDRDLAASLKLVSGDVDGSVRRRPIL